MKISNTPDSKNAIKSLIKKIVQTTINSGKKGRKIGIKFMNLWARYTEILKTGVQSCKRIKMHFVPFALRTCIGCSLQFCNLSNLFEHKTETYEILFYCFSFHSIALFYRWVTLKEKALSPHCEILMNKFDMF